MATRKALYVDGNGDYVESSGMFETSDFINTSAGAGDAGKPIVLDAAGKIDATMLDSADIDHGGLTGLADDDHTQYILVGGTRAFTGDQSMGTNQLTNVGDPTATGIDTASDDAIPMSFLASTATGEGASRIGIEDAAANYTSDNVEGALAELYSAIVGEGVTYTVGAGGVTKGDLCYVSANDTVLPYSPITGSERGIGLALATIGAAGTVTVARNDVVVTGVLTTATAGDVYYWDGSGLTTTIPSGSGNYVWQAGVAKNATDLHCEVRFIKKNT